MQKLKKVNSIMNKTSKSIFRNVQSEVQYDNEFFEIPPPKNITIKVFKAKDFHQLLNQNLLFLKCFFFASELQTATSVNFFFCFLSKNSFEFSYQRNPENLHFNSYFKKSFYSRFHH